jgi:hypothetical protein
LRLKHILYANLQFLQVLALIRSQVLELIPSFDPDRSLSSIANGVFKLVQSVLVGFLWESSVGQNRHNLWFSLSDDVWVNKRTVVSALGAWRSALRLANCHISLHAASEQPSDPCQ